MLGIALAAPCLTEVCQADPNSSTTDLQSLQAEVRALRAEVQSLREQQQPPPRSDASATSTPRLSRQEDESARKAVLEDAERHGRSMGLQTPSAGWSPDRGFFIGSDDGTFMLNPFVLLQVRDAMTLRQDARRDGRDDAQNGFEIRRLQLGLDGNVFSPDLTYRVFWQSSELTAGNLSLLMAWVQYRIHGTPWVIGGGQFKDPLDHEQLVSDADQLAVDRTFVDDVLAGGEAFSKGVDVRYDDGGPIRAEAAFTGGFSSNNTTFQSFPTNAYNFGVAARGEYKLMGNWKDYAHFTSLGSSGDLLVVGGGADWTEAGHTDAIRHVVDLQFNPGPVGVYAAYLGRYTSGNTAGRRGNTYDPSVRLQASYLFTPHWEAFARYDYVHLDGKEFKISENSTVHEITLGTNGYFRGERAKMTLDMSYLPDGSPTTDQGNDVLENSGHGELVVRAQFQLML